MDALGKLGIDGWGLVLYLVNFGVLLLLMQRFVYKPLVKMLDDRRDRIKEDVETASSLRASLEEEREGEEAERKKRQAQLDDQVSSVKKLARDEAKKVLTDAEAQRDAILSQAAKTADATIASTLKESEKEILERVQKVVMHVLEEGIPENVAKESVSKSWEAIAKSN